MGRVKRLRERDSIACKVSQSLAGGGGFEFWGCGTGADKNFQPARDSTAWRKACCG